MTKTAPDPAQRRQRVQSAETGLAVLKGLNRLQGQATLTALSEALGESPAKVHRYLASLVREGFVVQDAASQRYCLGPEALQIGLTAMRLCDPIRAAEPALVRLRETLRVTCFVAVWGNRGPTILRMEEPGLPVTLNVRAGSVMPLLWSATGLAFFGFLDGDEVVQQARRELDEATPEQRRRVEPGLPLDALRAAIRRRGCATVEGAMLPGISAVSAPVFDFSGRLVAVLTALGASGGFDAAPEGEIAAAVRNEAALTGASLGWSGAPR